MSSDGKMSPILKRLPKWARLAFLARSADRVLPLYARDQSEPQVQRNLVAQSIEVVKHRVAMGGDDLDEVVEVGTQFFDNYDIDAIKAALNHAANAALNTATDAEGTAEEIILAIQSFTNALFHAVFNDDNSEDFEQNAIKWLEHLLTLVDDPESSPVEQSLQKDLQLLEKAANEESWNSSTAVATDFFPEMWPDGQPANWPPLELSFRPRARIVRTIGDRLISGPEAAVIELVKNSHDADASQVTITFLPSEDGNEGSLVISDDGHGMTFDDIQHKWMEPATSDKRDRVFSPKGRRLLGSKGIGRFAASRLGSSLRLQSTAHSAHATHAQENHHQRTDIPNIDWDFFDTIEYLDQVRLHATSRLTNEPTGTVLKISRLRDEWTESQVRSLHYELRRLLSPIAEQDSPFQILVDLSRCTVNNIGFDGSALLTELGDRSEDGDLSHSLHLIRPFPLLDAADYSVDGAFDEEGNFSGTMTISRGGQEPEEISLMIPLSEQEESSCGIVLIRLSIFDRETDAVRQTALKAGLGSVGVREARKLIDSICGVALYREGFRIRPYGDADNDWLMLDKKRVQNPSQKIGHNQISGIVSVDDEKSSGLVERSSREGLEENASFRRLTRLISALLAEIVEPRRRAFRVKAGLEAKKDVRFADVYKKGELSWSSDLIQKLPESERPAMAEMIARESSELTAYLKKLEEHQALLQARVTAGQIVGEVMHQGNTPLSFIEDESARLDRWWPNMLEDSEASMSKRDQMPSIVNGLRASGGKLRKLFDALKPLSGARRGRPQDFDVITSIDNTIFLFRSRLDQLSIQTEITCDETSMTAHGYEADLSTVITNLVDNAIFWLNYHKVMNPKIAIDVGVDDNELVIHFKDNGTGIPSEFVEHVFDVGFTLKPSGTGLGLSIAREAIERSSGRLSYAFDSEGAHFVVVLPSGER